MNNKHTEILLIEDNPGDARLIREVLGESAQVEYQLESAGLLSKGLECLVRGGIDVVLLDLGLPDSQGLDTVVKVRTQAPAMPIVVLTGLDDETLAVQAVRQGAQDYLVKGDINSKVLWRVMRYAVERKKMQVQLIQSEKLGAVGMMAAGVAHELLNPMMGILNFAQFCLKSTTEDDPRYSVLQDIERETERCTETVRNLLTFSRTEKEGEEGYQKESFAQIIKRVVKLLTYRIRQEKVSLSCHVAEGTPATWLRVNSMQQVLLNLINNALDAVMTSQKKEIQVEVHQEGDSLRVTVADSGCGINPEDREKIFDPFFTTKPVGQGTGLGLTISRGIIHDHRGDIICESKPGLGTTFQILLPIKN